MLQRLIAFALIAAGTLWLVTSCEASTREPLTIGLALGYTLGSIIEVFNRGKAQ